MGRHSRLNAESKMAVVLKGLKGGKKRSRDMQGAPNKPDAVLSLEGQSSGGGA